MIPDVMMRSAIRDDSSSTNADGRRHSLGRKYKKRRSMPEEDNASSNADDRRHSLGRKCKKRISVPEKENTNSNADDRRHSLGRKRKKRISVPEEDNTSSNADGRRLSLGRKCKEKRISVSEEGNASANANGQPVAFWHTRGFQGELINTWNSFNFVWRYFTLEREPFTRCNICKRRYYVRETYLERHLMIEHSEVIKEIQNEIKYTGLAQYFAFDVDISRVRCIINNCQLSIFCGINSLINHLHCRHNIKSTKVYNFKFVFKDKRVKRINTNITLQVPEEDNASANDGQQLGAQLQARENQEKRKSVTEEDNASANDGQRAGTSSQVTDYQKDLINKGSSINLVWRYFTLEGESCSRCNVCYKRYSTKEASLQRHLKKEHSEIIKEIQKEIKHSWVSPYFAFDVEISKVRCIITNCQIDIFCGISSLISHLHHRHNINKNTQIDLLKYTDRFTFFFKGKRKKRINENITKQLPKEDDNASANGGQRLDAQSQVTKDQKKRISVTEEDNTNANADGLLPIHTSAIADGQQPISDCTCVYCDCTLVTEDQEKRKSVTEEDNTSANTDAQQPDAQSQAIEDQMKRISVTEEGNTSANTDAQQPDAQSQAIEDQMKRISVTEEGNTSANTDAQQPDAQSQAKENQEGLICTWNSNNLVWRYFTPKLWPIAKCNICDNHYNGEIIADLEDHLTHKHLHVVHRIQKAIRCTYLSSYFVFDVEDPMARCIINNCKINIFYGLTTLRDHLHDHHNIQISTKAFQTIQRSDTDVVMQQSVVKEDNTNTNAS